MYQSQNWKDSKPNSFYKLYLASLLGPKLDLDLLNVYFF